MTQTTLAHTPSRNRSFGLFLRACREVKGMTSRQLAEKAKMSRGYLSNSELGKATPPGEEKLRRLAGALEIDPDAMLARAGRVSAELLGIVIARPKLMGWLLRVGSRMSAAELGRRFDREGG